MSSSQGGKANSNVEMGKATSPAPIPMSPVEAPACVTDHLSFREKLVRRRAEKEPVQSDTEIPSSSALVIAPGHGTEAQVPQGAGTLANLGILDTSVLPAGSSTTPILVEDKERAAESMPPPPVRKEIVLALRAPMLFRLLSLRAGRGSSLRAVMGNLRYKEARFMSLIAGMISECGSEASRLAGELSELQGRWSETEAMLTAVKDSHSTKVSKLEVAIRELETDLGKTASSLLKERVQKIQSGKIPWSEKTEVTRLQVWTKRRVKRGREF
uniref:Uncharacterized protein n=1 Tax=Brassica campestris TaxID=3711 RepID=M4F9V5_BRACM